MKKIAFFLGRRHHAQKLLPIAFYGKDNGLFDTDILVADNAINIDPPTEFLRDYGITEYHHSKTYQTSQDDKDVHEVIRAVFQTDIIKSVSPFWILYSAREAIENMSGLSNYLRKNNPDAVFVLHGQNFWTKILAYHAKNMDIPVYSIQEGIILENEEKEMRKYTWATDYMSTVFTWSEDDRKFYGEPWKIEPVGPTHLDKWLKIKQDIVSMGQMNKVLKRRLGLERKKKTVTIAFPRLDLFRGDPERVIRSIGSWTVRRGHNVIVSLHPFQGRVPRIEKIIKIYPNMVSIIPDDPMELVLCSTVVVGQTGTLALEAIALDVPVAEVNFDNLPLTQPLHKQGGAFNLDKIDKMEELMENYTAADAVEFKEARLPLADGRSLERLMEHITNVGD